MCRALRLPVLCTLPLRARSHAEIGRSERAVGSELELALHQQELARPRTAASAAARGCRHAAVTAMHSWSRGNGHERHSFIACAYSDGAAGGLACAKPANWVKTDAPAAADRSGV